MSWWTNIRDVAEVVGTGGIAGAFNKNIANAEGAAFNAATGRPSQDDLRNQKYGINDQIKAYKEQTALTQQEIDTARAQQDVEKRRINEKQIRALRNNFRPAGGFLSSGRSSLGESTNLPNKLG